MPNISDLVNQARRSWEPGEWLLGQLKTGKRGWDKHYDEGTTKSVTDFVKILKSATRVQHKKNGDRKDERIRALGLVETDLLPFLDTGPFAFPNIKPQTLAFELTIRIREPKSIDQAESSFCTLAAYVIQLARDQPYIYASLVIQLFRFGRFRLGSLDIKASRELLRRPSNEGLGVCDQLVLHSLLYGQQSLFERFFNPGMTGIDSATLCNHLRNLGYQNVENHSLKFSMRNAIRQKELLQHMILKLNTRHRVVMLGTREIAESLRDKCPLTHSGHTVSSTAALHAVYVSKVIAQPSDRLEIKLYTWGESFKSIDIDTDAFVSQFFGFVSYQERF